MTELITTTAASGIGLDTPTASPRHTSPANSTPPTSRKERGNRETDEEIQSADKSDYKAEDEDEAMEADLSFDYSEDNFDGFDLGSYVGAETKENACAGLEEAKEISPPQTGSDTVAMEGASPTGDTFSMEKLSITQHVVVQKTVVEEYAISKAQSHAPTAATTSGLAASVDSFSAENNVARKANITEKKKANYPGKTQKIWKAVRRWILPLW
ncbi:hypothetical protein PHYBOEH_002103 [Phytophthora boehmeriae]|uniref:Uncharacterized protein n=1 Tax=Phytophthora boehmeriae TaxID=109152 RepID=A0A8T1XC61_9STRA|nr:hypothetical protein PHYBOEH_002103 [Phytophthora boehmeriae]